MTSGSDSLRLRPFDPADAATVSSWARSADEVVRWCSRSEIPVPRDVVTAWSSAADITAYSLTESDAVIGYGELWLDDDEAEVELARLIIEPSRRGRGVGRHLVRELTELARGLHPTVTMRVHPDNEPALRAYAAAGFDRVPAADEAAWNEGQPIAYVWMTWRQPKSSPTS